MTGSAKRYHVPIRSLPCTVAPAYDVVRIAPWPCVHKTLKMTPAMAAGVSDRLHDTAWIVCLIDANAPAPKKRGPYKKKTPPKE